LEGEGNDDYNYFDLDEHDMLEDDEFTETVETVTEHHPFFERNGIVADDFL
jgi:hypothetical protein